MRRDLAEIQWRWILGSVFAIMGVTSITLFFVIAIYAASRASLGEVPDREEINRFSELLGTFAGPFLFLSLVFLSSLWVALRVRVAPRLHGLLIGLLVSVAFILSELLLSPSFTWHEVLTSLLAIACGWAGGYRAEITLKNREALYHTSQAIIGEDRAGIASAIGEQLASPSVVLITLVDGTGMADPNVTWTTSSDLQLGTSFPALPATSESATVLIGDQLPWQIPGIRSLLLLPLAQVDETLLIASRDRKGFSRAEMQKYMTLAEQVALSLENLELVEQAHEAGITQERQRLAAEIHDGLTQGFISIVTHLEVAEARLETYPPDARENLLGPLDQARRTARDNLTASRQMVWALRPDLQEGVPLADALAKLATEWSAVHGIPVTFSTSGEAHQLHPDAETVILRTARESLNNVGKHAQADRVTVTLTYLDRLVAIDVQDNGCGFDLDAAPMARPGGGFGLRSLRAQAERVGGELSVESEPGKGTTIAASLPAD